jgi:hypothetical protein
MTAFVVWLLALTCLVSGTHGQSPATPSTLVSTPPPSPFSAPLVCLNGGVLMSRRSASAAATDTDSDRVELECACASGWSGERVSTPGTRARGSVEDRFVPVHSLMHASRLCSSSQCEYRDFCSDLNPCQHDSVCLNTFDGMLCRCTEGWIGADCSAPNTCTAESCLAPHGRCVVSEVFDHPQVAPRKKGPRKNTPDTTTREAKLLGGVTSVQCVCEAGWSGSNCGVLHAEQCSSIEPCTIFTLDHPRCGCRAALEHKCEWCLETGVAFAPGSAQGDSCLASVKEVGHCPPPAAQAIRQCAVMDGTSFGWCAVNALNGYAEDGNPSSPAVGAKRCHHWVWNAAGCKDDWTTGSPRSGQPTPAECSAVPPCFDQATASASLCGCQAALSIGCDWCLEQQLAFPPNTSSTTCRSWATAAAECPSQQAQTIHDCTAVGGLPFGWCAIDDAEPSMGQCAQTIVRTAHARTD